MKKYLIGGALALFAGLFITSCTHDDDLYSNADAVQQKKESFQKAFTKAYGTIASNQDWGFDRTVEYETTPSSTRNETKSRDAGTRTPAEFGWEVGSDWSTTFTKADYDYLLTFLEEEEDAGNATNNYEFRSDGPFQFSLMYSQTNGSDEVGYYYYDPETQTAADRTEVRFLSNISNIGDYLNHCRNYGYGDQWERAPQNHYNGIFGNSYTKSRAKVFTINVPEGYCVGFYVKQGSHTMYSNQALNEDARPEGQRYYSAVLTKDARGEFYVGLEDWFFDQGNLYNHKADCNDIVLAITPISDTPPTIVEPGGGEIPHEPVITYDYEYGYDNTATVSSGRIFCEDLGSNYSSRADFDYNDVVFDATIIKRQYYLKTTTYSDGVKEDENTVWDVVKPANGSDGETTHQDPRYFAKIELFAAGGTKPLSIFGKEVHAAFGVGGTTMVNTFDENSKRHTSTDENGLTTSAFGSYTYADAVQLKPDTPASTFSTEEAGDSDFPSNAIFEMQCKEGENGEKIIPNILDIPILVRFEDNAVAELSSARGNAPHMIQVPSNTRWPSERFDINEAYPGFNAYVGGGAEPWNNGVAECICEATPSLSTYIKGESTSVTTSSGGVTEKRYYSNEEGYDIVNGLYFNNANILSGLADGDRIRVHVKDVQSGYILSLNDGNSTRLLTDQTQLAGQTSGYIDFGMSQHIINSLNANKDKAALILSGTGLKVTSIGVVKK